MRDKIFRYEDRFGVFFTRLMEVILFCIDKFKSQICHAQVWWLLICAYTVDIP